MTQQRTTSSGIEPGASNLSKTTQTLYQLSYSRRLTGVASTTCGWLEYIGHTYFLQIKLVKMVSAVFVRVAAPRTESSLSSQSSRNLGSMAKIILHALSSSKKYMTGFLETNFGRFCWSMALMVSCYPPLIHSTADRRFVLR